MQDYLFDTSMGIGWFAGSANITGLALLVILTIMVICSHRAVRKSGYFEVSPSPRLSLDAPGLELKASDSPPPPLLMVSVPSR